MRTEVTAVLFVTLLAEYHNSPEAETTPFHFRTTAKPWGKEKKKRDTPVSLETNSSPVRTKRKAQVTAHNMRRQTDVTEFCSFSQLPSLSPVKVPEMTISRQRGFSLLHAKALKVASAVLKLFLHAEGS